MTSPELPAPEDRRPGWLRAYDALLHWVDTIVGYVVIVAMALLAGVLILQVFFRYVMNDSLEWGNDIPRLCFIMVVTMSIPLAFRFNAHVGMDFDLTKLKFISKPMVHRFNAIFLLALFATVSWYATQLANRTWDQMMPGVSLPVGLFYLSLAIGQAHCCLHVVRVMITGALPEHTEAFEA